MNEISFRPSTAQDLPALHRLIESVYRGENSKRGWTTEADMIDGQRTDAEALLEMQNSQASVFLLAFVDQELVGSVHLEKCEGYAYLGMLSVDVQV